MMKHMKKNLPHRLAAWLLCLCMFLSVFTTIAQATDNTTEEPSGAEQSTSSETVSDPEPIEETKVDPDTNPIVVSENPTDEQQPDSRATTPKEFTVNIKFQEKDTKTPLGRDGKLTFEYYNGTGFRRDYNTHYSTDGIIPMTVQSGSLYFVKTNLRNTSYMPDMDVVIGPENGIDVAYYVSDTGVEVIHAGNIDRLMQDPNFKALLDGFFKDPGGMSYLIEMTGIYGYTQEPTEEKLMECFMEYISRVPELTATEDAGTYELALDYSKRPPLPPFQIVTVDENGQPLGGLDTSKGTVGDDGVVFDSQDPSSQMPIGIYMFDVNGVIFHDDGSKTSYIRKNAEGTPQYPAGTYNLMLYIGPDCVEFVTASNFDELCKDPQFLDSARHMDAFTGGTSFVKTFAPDYPDIVIEDEKITLPFVSWQGPTIQFKAVDSDNGNAPLEGIHWYARSNTFGNSGNTASDGMVSYTVLEPGLLELSVSSSDYEYMASHDSFRYIGNESDAKGTYPLKLWVKADGTTEIIDDAKLKELCQDEAFIKQMERASLDYDSSGIYEYLMGVKPDYESLKKAFKIRGDFTLDEEHGIPLLPFTKEMDLELSGTKDETVIKAQEDDRSVERFVVTYECPEDGTYLVGWDSSTYCDDDYVDMTITGPDYEAGTKMPAMENKIPLKKGTYTITMSKKRNYAYGYWRVFVEKQRDLDPKADLHTADYIKDGDRYTNIVAFSGGQKMEHMILAVYPGALQEADESWTFNVAVPSGADYQKDSLKLYYVPNSGTTYTGRNVDEYFGTLKDEIKMEDLAPLQVTSTCTPAASYNQKTIYSMSLKDIADVEAGDIVVATYTSTVNNTAWYGAIADINMSYGYWSIQNTAGETVEQYDAPIPAIQNNKSGKENWVDPAICQVFGIKIYKYSNYDRMLSESQSDFDSDVMMQEHLLAGAEFKIEGDNLDKVIVIRDDLVETEAKTAESPAMLRAARSVNRKSDVGSMLVHMMGEETLMKLLYYRYEQGLQDLSNVSVAQTQTYYALHEDDYYTRVAPQEDTLQFYADNGQGYRLKPSVFSAKAGDSIQAGDGGGLLLGGLGAGEYTLTETVAPEGYALMKPMTISITWVKRDPNNRYGYIELPEGEVPDRSGEYGLLCKINDKEVATLMNSFVGGSVPWYPGQAFFGDAPSFESIWNPNCYVLVNPIGDDRISFTATKEVNDPGDEEKEFELQYTIKDPDGNICTDVKYALLNKDGQFEIQDEVITRAEDWSYSVKPGQQIAFVNLLEGSTYEVKEEDGTASQYVVSYENETGTVQYGGAWPEVKVINKKATLVVSKTVTGKGDKSKSFTFGFELTDQDGNALTDVTYMKGTIQGSINSGDALQLKHGESVTLYLPNGAHYKVEELEANQDGYTTKVENGEGTITGLDPIEVSVTNHKEGEKTPSTGDISNATPWFVTLVLSGFGLAMLALSRRKKFD